MKKRFVSMLLALSMCMGLAVPAFAAEEKNDLTDTETAFADSSFAPSVYNEGEAYIAMRAISDSTLEEMGCTASEIEEIRSFNMEEALLERAALPDETLRAYGYTDNQIDLLRDYDGTQLELDSPVLAATSDCTGVYGVQSASDRAINFSYTWTWDIVPLVKMQDEVVVAWQAIRASDNGEIDVTGSGTMSLHFYNLTTGERASNKDSLINGVHQSSKDCMYFKFDMTKEDNYYWAKEGVAYISLYVDNPTSSSSTKINYIDLGSGYGHQRVAGNFEFAISSELAISFTPALVVTKMKDASVYGRVYSNGRVINYGSEK